MTQGTPSAEEVLMGGGRPAARFDNVGDVAGGKIVTQPQTHREHELKWDGSRYVKGDPKSFQSGDPIYGLTVDVQTSQRSGPDDDGVRRIWIEGKRLKEAVRSAVREAGAQRLEVGGELWVKYTGDGEPASPQASPPKLWDAKYTAPSGPVTQDEAWGPPAQQAPPPAEPPAQQAPPPQQQQQQAPPPAEPPAQQWGDEPPF